MSTAVQGLQRGWDRLDRQVVRFMAAHSIRLLRIALALVFLWFGLLKVIGRSPASDLVVQTVFWLPPHTAVQVIGWWETLIGVGLLFTTPLILRLTLMLLWLQMAGTFQVLVLLPQVAFQGGNPLFPTLEGQHVIKNLVLIAGGLVIGSTVRRSSR